MVGRSFGKAKSGRTIVRSISDELSVNLSWPVENVSAIL